MAMIAPGSAGPGKWAWVYRLRTKQKESENAVDSRDGGSLAQAHSGESRAAAATVSRASTLPRHTTLPDSPENASLHSELSGRLLEGIWGIPKLLVPNVKLVLEAQTVQPVW